MDPEEKAMRAMEDMFSLEKVPDEFPEYLMPPSPASSVTSQKSQLDEELDSILNDVLSSMGDLDSILESAPSSPEEVDLNLTEQQDLNTIRPTLETIYKEIPEPRGEDMYDDVMQVQMEYAECKPSPPVVQLAAPLGTFNLILVKAIPHDVEQIVVSSSDEIKSSPSSPTPRYAPEVRKQRKRVSNLHSSRRYREKIKNKENTLFQDVEELSSKKLALQFELVEKRAVNDFLVADLRKKFAALL